MSIENRFKPYMISEKYSKYVLTTVHYTIIEFMDLFFFFKSRVLYKKMLTFLLNIFASFDWIINIPYKNGGIRFEWDPLPLAKPDMLERKNSLWSIFLASRDQSYMPSPEISAVNFKGLLISYTIQ